MEIRTSLDNHGRLLIPSSLRKELGYSSRDIFVLRVVSGELRVLKLQQVIAEAQATISKHVKPGESLLEGFLQMRKEDRKQEKSRLKRK